jgi:hypothetical protein
VPQGCNLFVYHLPLDWTDAALTAKFSKFGRYLLYLTKPTQVFHFRTVSSILKQLCYTFLDFVFNLYASTPKLSYFGPVLCIPPHPPIFPTSLPPSLTSSFSSPLLPPLTHTYTYTDTHTRFLSPLHLSHFLNLDPNPETM